MWIAFYARPTVPLQQTKLENREKYKKNVPNFATQRQALLWCVSLLCASSTYNSCWLVFFFIFFCVGVIMLNTQFSHFLFSLSF